MPASLRRRVGALTVVAVVATACAGTPGPGSSPPPPASSDAAELLDFTAPLVGGGTVRGAELAGRDLAIWFWAPW